MRHRAIVRIRIITATVLFLAFLLLGRLYQVQIARGELYAESAERQYVHTVQELYSRGSIFLTTKDGEKVSAATIQSGYLLAINPKVIEDSDAIYHALSALIALDRSTFDSKVAKQETFYQELAHTLSEKEAEAIEALALKGVSLYRNQWRYYPGGALSARTIGFVGYDGDALVGKYGLERYYNDVLLRERERMSVNFFAEIFSTIGANASGVKNMKRGDVVTSIEPTVARSLDRVLLSVQETWQSAVTGGIIINPRTGAILSLGVIPSYDLNDRSAVDISMFRNPLVEDVYELGSIIKPLTVASGLDAGAITPESIYYDAGFIDLNEFTIKNYDGKGRGYVSMQEVLNQSLNTGVAHIVKTMGKEKFREYFYKLKLGTETGVDLPSETYGLVTNLESPRDVEYATAAFGQGIALTPIAAVRALSTLANGGTLITPHIGERIEYETGAVQEISFPAGDRVFGEKTSEDITRMLVMVVDKALKGGTVSMEHHTIAAKTGTAQIADNENGGYYEDRFLHSFFGYFPAYNPQFFIFLYTVEPKGVRFASETLTDPFMELTRFLINYYNVPPDR